MPSKIVLETYNERIDKAVQRVNDTGRADQVVQFITEYEDHDSLVRSGWWTTVVYRVPDEPTPEEKVDIELELIEQIGRNDSNPLLRR